MVGGTNDLGVHLALWVYQASNFCRTTVLKFPRNWAREGVNPASGTTHLVARREATNTVREGSASTALGKVLNTPDLSTPQFSSDDSPTFYGIDSLAATRISEASSIYKDISDSALE